MRVSKTFVSDQGIPMLLQVALNGSRAPAEHPTLPVTPTQIAAEAGRAVAAGAMEIHLHVRRADETESLAPDDVAQTLTLVVAEAHQPGRKEKPHE
jgi:uncharacterized protein (DUF849 family)